MRSASSWRHDHEGWSLQQRWVAIADSKRILHLAVSARLNVMLRSDEQVVLSARHAVKGGGSARVIISFDLLEQWTASASTKYKILAH